MNRFATLFALKKAKAHFDNLCKEAKTQIQNNHFASMSDIQHDTIRAKLLRDAPKGHYRVNFGDLWSNVFFDGSEFFLLYSTPKESSTQSINEAEAKKYKFLSRESLCKLFEFNKDEKPKTVIAELERRYPGISNQIDLKVNTYDVVSTTSGKNAPNLADALADSKDPYFINLISSAEKSASFGFSSGLDQFEFSKKILKKLESAEKFFVNSCLLHFEANPYIKISEQSRLFNDDDKLGEAIANGTLLLPDIFYSSATEEKENKPKLGYCGQIKEIGRDGLYHSDLLSALDSIVMQRNSTPKNTDIENIFKQYDKNIPENKKTGRLSR